MQTQYQNLPAYQKEKNGNFKKIEDADDDFKGGFFIPENVYIIGTMNDIDRSVESMDFALRRRFVWKEIRVENVIDGAMRNILKVEYEKLNLEGNHDSTQKIEEIAAVIAECVKSLNKKIEDPHNGFFLDRNYDISQGQFTGLPKYCYEGLFEAMEYDKDSDDYKDRINEFLKHVWDYRIESLLRDYTRGEDNADFIKDCKNKYLLANEVKQGNSEEKDSMENEDEEK